MHFINKKSNSIKALILLSIMTPLSAWTQVIDIEYFQQQVDNTIRVTLDDQSHLLRGDIDIKYKNNSKDTLSFIYFHLWPRAYSTDRSAFNKQQVENGDKAFYQADKNDWGTIDSIQFTVNDVPAVITPTEEVDVVKLILPSPLLPAETIDIHTPFKIIIPYTFSRMGHKGQSYQITQWYPKPAVYDHEGWHPMPYLNQGEFYSEFGSFDVSITLPQNYVVIATGNLQTKEEQAFMTNRALHPPTDSFSADTDPPSSTQWKTVRYTEDNIHDFAWFADKRWHLLIKDFTIPETGKKVTSTSAYFPWHKEGWQNSDNFLIHGVKYFSEKVGPYLYETVKAVEGPLPAGGGMEYPTVTIIIPSNDSDVVRKIIVHEVGHNWFYGMLANNEREHPWMDESINSYVETKAEQSYHNEERDRFFRNNEDLGFMQLIAERRLHPIVASAPSFRSINYGADLYRRGAMTLEWLAAYMGQDTFDKAMRYYYDRFKLRHVHPTDFYDAIGIHNKRNTEWFRHALYNTDLVDFSIRNMKHDGNTTTLTVRNKSKLEAPAIIDLGYSDDTSFSKIKTIVVEPFLGDKSITIDNEGSPYDQATISQSVPDMNFYNNHYYNGRNFHPRIKLIPSINNITTYDLHVMPILGYNYHDGFQVGGILHNFFVLDRRFQFALMPAYGFKSRNIIGGGYLSYKQYPNNKLHHIEYKISGKTYGYKSSKLNVDKNMTARYYKVSPEVIFSFSPPLARTPIYRTLSFKGYIIGEEAMKFGNAYSDSLYRPSLEGMNQLWYASAQYKYDHVRVYNPYSYSIALHGNDNFLKLMLEGNLRVDYHYKNAGLNVRAFVGRFFDIANVDYSNNRYWLNATHTNYNDYLYDETVLGRNINNHDLWSKQIMMREGGLKIPTNQYSNPLGRSNGWLGSVNLSSDIPFVPIVKVFADVATFTDASLTNPSGAKLLYDAGFEVSLGSFCQVYIPVLYSRDYTDYLRAAYGKKGWLHAITFSINFNEINWSNPFQSHILKKVLR